MLEAGSPRETINYLLRHREDNEPTMIAEQLRKAKNLERATWAIVDVFQAVLTTAPMKNFPPNPRPYVTEFSGPIAGAKEL